MCHNSLSLYGNKRRPHSWTWTFLGDYPFKGLSTLSDLWLCAVFIHLQRAFLSLIEGCIEVTKLAQVWTQWNRILFSVSGFQFVYYWCLVWACVLEYIGVVVSNVNAFLHQGAGVRCPRSGRTLWGICRHRSQSDPTWHTGVLPRPRWVTRFLIKLLRYTTRHPITGLLATVQQCFGWCVYKINVRPHLTPGVSTTVFFFHL